MTQSEISSKMIDLHHSGEHTPEDLAFIKKHLNRAHFVAIYFIWRQHRHNGKNFGFLIYNSNHTPRRAAVWKSIEILHERPLTNIEFQEQCENYGCNNRVATVWNYGRISELVKGDKYYNLETPQVVIDAIKRRNFEQPLDQLKLELETI